MKNKDRKACKRMDNRGVSLMELLVSMIILLLIMVPLLENFIRSARVNEEAEKLQDYSDLAADMVEDIKIRSISETLANPDYDYANNGLTLNADHTYSSFTTSVPHENYYLGFVREDNGIKYDILLKLSAQSYEYDGAEHDGTLMNSYEMPDISAVDEEVNGMFFTNMYQDQAAGTFGIKDDPLNANDRQLDRIALEYYKAAAYAYAQEEFRRNEYAVYLEALSAWTTLYQEAVLEGTTPPAAPTEPVWSAADYSYCDENNIKSWMSKTVNITLQDSIVSGSEVNTVIIYRITYHCDWTECPDTDPAIAQDVSWNIDRKTYGTSINKVYLYYESFLFQNAEHSDEISITNDRAADVDVFLVNQEGNMPTSPVKVYCSGGSGHSSGSGVKLYTNLSADKIALEGASSGMHRYSTGLLPPQRRTESIR